MASNKAFLLLALLVALVLVVAASRDLAPTSPVKENGKTSDVVGVGDYVPDPNPPAPSPKGCRFGCCIVNRFRCISCCRHAGEAVDSAEP